MLVLSLWVEVHPYCALIDCRACLGPALCPGCVYVHVHCAQTVCRACMGARTVLRLWAKSARALCSDCFFFFVFFLEVRYLLQRR